MARLGTKASLCACLDGDVWLAVGSVHGECRNARPQSTHREALAEDKGRSGEVGKMVVRRSRMIECGEAWWLDIMKSQSPRLISVWRYNKYNTT